MRNVKALLIALAVVLAGSAAYAQSIPTPSDFLKMKIGDDGVLANYEQIVSYWRAVDKLSDRITVQDLGPTTMGHPYIVAIITSPENQKKLDYYRDINNRLYDARRTNDDQAKPLIAAGKTIIAMQCAIHSTELGAPQLSMELAYRFATENTDRMKKVLDDTIIILSPSHNPDGTQMVAEWNAKYRGTPYQNGPLPFLYHKYTGHDDNRDWYMFTQKESQITVTKIWNVWHPEISYDLHQMGSNAARIYMPPYVDPTDPNVDPILRAEINALGGSMSSDLTGEGRQGVLINGIYDAWTPARMYANYHGGIRFLTEVASANWANPITLRFDQLGRGIGYDAKQDAWNFPRPWRGGTWRLRDIMDYEHSAVDALLDYAAAYRERWLTNFYRVAKNSIGRTDPETGAEKPYAEIVPLAGNDPLATYEMLHVFQLGDIEISRARAPFTAGGQQYPAGTFVILYAQPASSFAKTLTEVQHYPDLRQYPGGPPQRPYDVTAYTMPLMMGVKTTRVQNPFKADLEPIKEPLTAPAGSASSAPAKIAYAFAHDDAGIRAMTRLTKAGLRVLWASAPFSSGGQTYPAGTILVPVDRQGAAQRAVADAAKALPIQVHAVNDTLPKTLTVKAPRVGMYKSFAASMDEGWTRWLLEQWGIEYASLENDEVRAGNLRAKFDAIVLPQQSPAQMINGLAAGQVPAEYAGGLGTEGVAALRSFVEAGGTLVALDSASMLPIQQFHLPIKNVLQGLSGGGRGGGALGPDSAAFYAPGSIVKTKVDVASPIAYGSDPESIAWFEQSPAFEVSGNAQTIVSYPAAGSPLLSGWLLGAEKLNGKSAVVEVPMGKGRVILFGFRPQYRAQTWVTFNLFLNSLYYATATEAAPQTTKKVNRH
jgi:hypothetical protein